MELVQRVPVFVGPGAGGRLQRVEKLLLLRVIEFKVLAGRSKSAPVGLGRDPLCEACGRRWGIGPAGELRHEEGRSSLGHAPGSIGEKEADGRHKTSVAP